MPLPTPAQFESRYHVEPTSGCWLWLGYTEKGYGRMGVDGRVEWAHRASYKIHVGPIPDGMVLDHVRARGCASTACVNPAHLEPVTQTENIARGDTGIVNRSKTHCPAGHAYEDDNTSIAATGQRVCRLCQRAKTARWRARRGR